MWWSYEASKELPDDRVCRPRNLHDKFPCDVFATAFGSSADTSCEGQPQPGTEYCASTIPAADREWTQLGNLSQELPTLPHGAICFHAASLFQISLAKR